MKHLFFLIVLLFSASLFAEDITIIKNIPYVKDGGERQQLDLYLPNNYKTCKPLPVILAIHGGGWQHGNKDVAAGWAKGYVPKGYAVAGINYRLKPEFKMPAQIADCKSAIRWLRANAEEYNLDVKHFGAWGHSAGAHLSALLGVNDAVKEFDIGENLQYPSTIQAVVAWAAPTDFESWQATPKQRQAFYPALFGDNEEEAAAIAKKVSPALQVNKSAAPMLIVHAEDDKLVPFAQSQELYDALQKAGVESIIIKLAAGDGGHSSKSFHSPENAEAVREFLQKYLKPAAE